MKLCRGQAAKAERAEAESTETGSAHAAGTKPAWAWAGAGAALRKAPTRFALAILFVGIAARAPGQGPAPAGVSGQVVEDIVAVVGDRPVVRSDVEAQFEALATEFKVESGDTAEANALRREILGRLVDDQVILLEADAQDLEVTEEELNQSVEMAVQTSMRQLGGKEAFEAQLKKEALTEDLLRARYREEARKQLVATKLINKEVRPHVTVSDEEVKKFYQEKRSDLPKKPRGVHLQDLFLVVRPDSVLEQRSRQRALEVRQEVLGGLVFDEAAKKYSDDPNNADRGGALGRFGRNELDRSFEAAAFAAEPNKVTDPVRSRFGYHLILVTAKDPDGQWVEASHILFSVTPTRADENQTFERAKDIRRQVASGKIDWAAAIRQYSEDAETRERDGDLGWIPMQGFGGAVKETIDTLRVGRISQPVPGDGGYHIFKLLGEEAEGMYNYEEIQEDLRQLAFQDAMEKKMRTWLDQLRTKYFVEIRAPW